MSFKQEVVLGRRTVCHDQMLLNVGINPALLHGWLMFSLWKHWGPCEISEVQGHWDNDNSGAVDFAVNWVHVANMCRVKNVCSNNTRSQQESSHFWQHNLNRLSEKTLRWWTLFFCVHHLCLQHTNQSTKLPRWVSLFILGERLNSFLYRSRFSGLKRKSRSSLFKQRREFIGSGKRMCRSAASFRQGWNQGANYFCRTAASLPCSVLTSLTHSTATKMTTGSCGWQVASLAVLVERECTSSTPSKSSAVDWLTLGLCHPWAGGRKESTGDLCVWGVTHLNLINRLFPHMDAILEIF